MTKRKRMKPVKAWGKVGVRHIDRLYMAAKNYIEKSGGSVQVIGGIQVQRWPGDGEHKFTIGLPCIGTAPKFVAKE